MPKGDGFTPRKDGTTVIYLGPQMTEMLQAVQQRLVAEGGPRLNLPSVARYLIDLGYAQRIRDNDYLVDSGAN